MEATSILDLVARLGSEDDSARKMAVFKLQTAIGDPSFADVFILEGGGPKLASLSLKSHGNTLAYALTTYSRLLELDKGWEYVTPELIERAVQLVVTQPVVNILRSAVSLLVAIVSRPQVNRNSSLASNQPAGFRALKPAVAIHTQFLQMLVNMLSSAETLLCANALQLINSLVRDTVTNDQETEWPMFIKRLQDLGVIKAVYVLMQSTALQDLAQPILEFQSLTKIMLRKWREVKVDLNKADHKRAIRSISTASYSEGDAFAPTRSGEAKGSKKHRDPERWRRVGFESESPGPEFAETGFLGMMDLTDFVMKNEDQFKKLVLEQAVKEPELRCPIAKASLAVTLALFDHFEIDKAEVDDAHRYAVLESRTNFEKAFKPLLLHWSRLHTAGLNAYFRLWKATGAKSDDFDRIAELVKILIEQVVGQASRTKDVVDAEEEMVEYDFKRLRELQMELLELTYEDAWGHHLRQVRDELNHEALQFVKEQRIRCLLQGSWFPNNSKKAEGAPAVKHPLSRSTSMTWRFVRLSHNRRYLHYGDYEQRKEVDPSLDELSEKIDLSIVSSVVSNVSAESRPSTPNGVKSSNEPSKVGQTNGTTYASATSTKITIHGYLPNTPSNKESILLQLWPQSHTVASEWLDGLLMLLNQQPITAETNKLVNLIGGYGLKIRLLNVRFEDLEAEEPVLPSREGLDEDYYFDIGGMEAGA